MLQVFMSTYTVFQTKVLYPERMQIGPSEWILRYSNNWYY